MATRPEVQQSSTPELFAGVLSDAKEIAVGHLGRMRSEIGDELKELKQYLARVVIAAGVMVVASLLAGETIALGLVALGLPGWAGFALATVIAVVAGVLLVKRMPGSKQNMDLVPEEAMNDLKSDLAQIGDKITH
jgi:hypothetical protein